MAPQAFSLSPVGHHGTGGPCPVRRVELCNGRSQ